MASNSPTLTTHKSLFSHRFVGFSSTPKSPFNSQAPKVPRSSCCQPFSLASSTISTTITASTTTTNSGFKDSGRFRLLGTDHFRVSEVSGGGGGGSDDGNSNSGGGGGGGGDGGGGGGGTNWSLLSWYLNLLEKYPVWTKAGTSALLTFVGDLICQLVIDKVPSLDMKRTAVFTLLGFILVGPTLHFWYLYLSKLFTSPGGSGAFLRLLLDQFLFSPIFIGVFLSTLVTLEGRPSQVIPKLRQEWFSSVLANWQLWIPFQFLNFRFVPQQFQVLAANFIALVWNVILSYKAHKEVLPK